jgi:hypothetical protein
VDSTWVTWNSKVKDAIDCLIDTVGSSGYQLGRRGNLCDSGELP